MIKAVAEKLYVNTKFTKSGETKRGGRWQTFSCTMGKDPHRVYWNGMYFGDRELAGQNLLENAQITIDYKFNDFKNEPQYSLVLHDWKDERVSVDEIFKIEEVKVVEAKKEDVELDWVEEIK